MELNAKKYSNREALVFRDERLTYAQLNARVNQLANGLRDAGFRPGDHCAVMFANRVEFVETVFALSKIGVTFVCLSTLLAPKEIQFIVDNADARGLIVEADFAEKVRPVMDQLPRLEDGLRFAVGGDVEGFQPLDSARADDSSDPGIVVHEDHWMRLAYTSGTTGLPKGVIHTHRMQTLMFFQFAVEYGLTEDERMLIAGPMYAIGPFVFSVMTLYFGGTLVLLRSFDAHEVLRTITQEKITASFMVPTMYNLILAIPEQERAEAYDVTSLRVLASGSAPRHKATRQKMFDYFSSAKINDSYGSTEGGLNSNLKHRDQLRKIDTVGQSVVGCDLRIVDDAGNDLPYGEVGELWVRGLSIASGYYKNKEATEDNFRDGWFTTGDLAVMDEERFITLVDRKKDVIISGGVNVYPTEVEQELYAHDDVLEAAVIGIPDDKWGEAVTAVVVPKEGATIDADALLGWMRGRVADYKRPKSIVVRDALPKNAAGKILKRELREEFWEGQDRRL